MMQHRAYQPALPTANKYLQQKWDMASYEFHRRKVKSAKPTVNTTPPRTFPHLVLRLKKQQLEEDWKMKVQRENDMLKEKISHIMRTTGVVDSRNYYDKKSLSKEKRQLEFLRITKENQKILFYLTHPRSYYSVRRWNEDWLKTLKVMDSIARYPRVGANQQKTQEKPRNMSSDCEKKQEIYADGTTRSPASDKINGKAALEDNRNKKDTSKKEDAGTEIHKETDAQLAS